MHTCPRCGYKEGMTVPAAAEYLGCSDQTVRNYLHAGRFPGAVAEKDGPGGKRYFIPLDQLDAVKPEVEAQQAKQKRKEAAA